MKVLVVDDNAAITKALQRIITSESRTVKIARSAAEGYFEYIIFNPDVVITDIEMPGESGIEMVKAIRRHDPSIRAIYASGNLEKHDTALKQERICHHAAVLEKPFSMHTVLKIISEIELSFKSEQP
jgi:YesN/AraC family two-component response regulator